MGVNIPGLPYRGDGHDRPATVPLPPGRMPFISHGRPLKKWRYVGLYGADVMLCAGVVHVAGMAQTFWAVWDGERLHERTRLRAYKGVVVERDEVAITDGAVRVQATLSVAGDPIEVVSAHGR